MRVQLFASVRELAGTAAVEIDVAAGTPVRAVIAQLVARYPALSDAIVDGEGRLRDAVSIFANGRNIRLFDGLDTRLSGDEELAVFPPVAGGA